MISIEGTKPAELDAYLFNKHKIHATTIVREAISGVRITPNVYTTAKNLVVLVEGITAFAKL